MKTKPQVRYELDTAYIVLPIRKGEFREITLDAADVPIVLASKVRWFLSTSNGKHYYATRRGRTQSAVGRELLHRLLMGNPDGKLVDHVNRNTLDNRRVNLRIVSHKENSRNKESRTNTTGVPNVGFDQQRNMYTVFFSFDTLEEAKKAAEVIRELRGY